MQHRPEADNRCFAQGARLRTKSEHLMRRRPEANNRCFAQGARLRTKSEHLMRWSLERGASLEYRLDGASFNSLSSLLPPSTSKFLCKLVSRPQST
jgi:hypothetical protein